MKPGSLDSLVVVQHCQSEHHVNGMTGGWTDTPLTALGRRQAEAVAARLGKETAGAPCRLYTSDLLRASQTAGYIAEALSLSPQIAPELREFNNGIATGMTQEEAAKVEAPMPPEGPGIDRQPFPKSETWRTFHARVTAFLDRLSADPAPGIPILVAHGGTVINIIAWWLLLDVEMLGKISFGIAPGGITLLTTNSWHERTLKTLSDTWHLPAPEAADPS